MSDAAHSTSHAARKLRLIFMGSPQFAVPSLETLAASNHEIVAVVTQPDRPSGRNLKEQPPAIKVCAQRLALPVLQPVTTKTPEFVAEISQYRPDVFVVVAYGEILRPALLKIPPVGAVNLHASLLPKYRGAAPIAWAIFNGETETGATTMLMNEGMDAGSILLQQTVPILSTDTTGILTDKIANLGADLLAKTLDLLAEGKITPAQQDPSRVTYAPKLKKEDGILRWIKTAEEISRQIRAFDPWPGSYSWYRGKRLKFWVARPVSGLIQEEPGVITRLTADSFFVSAGGGTILEVIQVQPENRPRLTAADFLHGYRVQKGDKFSDEL